MDEETGDRISVSGGEELVSEELIMLRSDGKTALMTGRVKRPTRPICIASDAVVTE